MYDDMSDVSMRQLLKKLEKEKAEAEWQLRDCEWRLDHEAAVCEPEMDWNVQYVGEWLCYGILSMQALHKAEEEKQSTLTKLGQVSLKQDEYCLVTCLAMHFPMSLYILF